MTGQNNSGKPKSETINIHFGDDVIEINPEQFQPDEVISQFKTAQNADKMLHVFSQVFNKAANGEDQNDLDVLQSFETSEDAKNFLIYLADNYEDDPVATGTMEMIWSLYGVDDDITDTIENFMEMFCDDPKVAPFFDLFDEGIAEEHEEHGYSYANDNGQSQLKLNVINDTGVTFGDVGGLDEIHSEIKEIVHFIQNPAKILKLGGEIPKGILMSGPPGTGKSLTAKAIASECKVPFIPLIGSQFESKYVGEGRDRIEEAFKAARKQIETQKKEGKTPSCIIFIDEIDAIGKTRGNNDSGANNDTILIELLAQMDGFVEAEGIMVIAATNRPEDLDPALSSRFGKKLIVPLPTQQGRLDILKIQTANMPMKKDVDLNEVAQKTFSFSGRDLKKLVNEAAMNASRRKSARKVGTEDFSTAYDRVTLGTKRNLNMPIEEKESTAIHEAGHAITGLRKEHTGFDPLSKVTILPHDNALGLTLFAENQESYSKSLKQFKADLVVSAGGRVAEELIYGTENVSSGATGDIEYATGVAERMVTEAGFNEKLGPMKIGNSHSGFLGRVASSHFDPDTAKLVREEVKRLLQEAYEEARKILTEDQEALILLAEALIEKETLLREDVIKVTGIKPQKPEPMRLNDIKKQLAAKK